jgi:cyclic pyranopterin phosphate synthase
LRLTASGKLRSCLLSDTHVDIKTPLRNGCSDADLADIFRQAVAHKPSEHCLSADGSARIAGQMSAIGG